VDAGRPIGRYGAGFFDVNLRTNRHEH
jgi:hypothetical protein